jgi:hypothetical protein
MESRRSPGSRSSSSLTVGAEVWPSLQPEPGIRTKIRAARSSAVDHPPSMEAWSRAGPARPDLGLSLGRHAVVTWAMATTGGRRIASPLDCGKQGQQKGLVLSRMRRAPCCGKRRAGRRAAWWRQLIGEEQLSWHAGRCWARRRRQVPSLWFWVVDGADWPAFGVPAAKTGAPGKDKSGADMQGQLSGGCGLAKERDSKSLGDNFHRTFETETCPP